MKKHEIALGATYAVKVSGRVVPVQIIAVCGYGGWYGRSRATGKPVRVRSSQRCRWRCADDGTLNRWQEATAC